VRWVLAGHLLEGLDRTLGELVIGPVQADVQRHFAPVRAGARTKLLAVLDSQRYFALLDELDKLLAEPPLTPKAAKPAAEVLPAAARRPYRQVRRRMHRAHGAGDGQSADAALHRRARPLSAPTTPARP
jgi:CHAD domain-containing protein